MKRLARRCGADWTLVSFTADLDVLLDRCLIRNQRTDAIPIDHAALAFLASTYEAPAGEGETLKSTN